MGIDNGNRVVYKVWGFLRELIVVVIGVEIIKVKERIDEMDRGVV